MKLVAGNSVIYMVKTVLKLVLYMVNCLVLWLLRAQFEQHLCF